MPRTSRNKSSTGIYHVLTRGINRQDIFLDCKDGNYYCRHLSKYKEECGFCIYAYCLMSNHVHLLLKEGDTPLADVMKKLNTSYASWFNWRYERVGHLFQDRFKSEPVENDSYLLTLVRYIHQNPVKIGLPVSKWTSYNDYISQRGLTDTDFVLSLFSDDVKKAKEQFIQYVNKSTEDKCLDITEAERVTNEKAREIIRSIGRVPDCKELKSLEPTRLSEILLKLKDENLTVRQIEKLTGINRGKIQRA